MIAFGSALFSSVRYSNIPVDFKHSASDGSTFFYLFLSDKSNLEELPPLCGETHCGMSALPHRAVFSLKVDNIKPQLGQFILLVPYGKIVVTSDRLQIFWFILLACCHPRCRVSSRTGSLRTAHGARHSSGGSLRKFRFRSPQPRGFGRPAPLRHVWAETSQSR